VILQMAYAGVLAFMLLAHRNSHRRQILRIPASFETRVRLAGGAGSARPAQHTKMWGVLLGVPSFVPLVERRW
jgi:hypothetical protein